MHEPHGSPGAPVRFVVLAWLCGAAAIAYLCRTSLAVAESTVRGELGLSEKEMGAAMSAFFLAYAIGQVPSGWIAHLWGTRRLLPVLSTLWSLATAALGLASGLWLLVGARAAGGLAQAGLFPASTNTVAKWFPETGRAFASGSLASFMSVGAAIGTGLTGVLLAHWSWRWVFIAYSLPGTLWAVGFYIWFRDRPSEHRSVSAGEGALLRDLPASEDGSQVASGSEEPTPWLGILTSPAMWWICAQQFFRAAAYMFFGSWFPTYLQKVHGVTTSTSGLLTMLPLLAVVGGSLLGGFASDRILALSGSRGWARKGLAAMSQVSCGSLVFAAYFIHDPMIAVAMISAGTFCFALAGPCAYSITIDMGGRHVATVFSVMNLCGNLGATLFPVAVPWFQEAAGSWDSVLILFGAMYVGSAVSWLLLNPAGTIFTQSILAKESTG